MANNDDKKKKNEIVLDETVYPLFDETENAINNIEVQFQEVMFNGGILTAEQEDKLFDFFNNPNFDFNVQKNIQALDNVENKLNIALNNKQLTESVVGKARYNLKNIYIYKEKLHSFKKTKTKLVTKTKEDKSTEKSLILNEASTNISDIQDKKKDREDEKKGKEKPIYVDNIGKSEDTYLRFYDYNREKNQKERVSITKVMQSVEKRTQRFSTISQEFNQMMNDDLYMARHQDNVKEFIINASMDLNGEKNWASEILADLNSAGRVTDLDNQMKDKLKTMVSTIESELSKLQDCSKTLDYKLANNKDKYNQVLKDDIEKEISNLYIDKLTDGVESNKENNELSTLYEKFVIISSKIEQMPEGSEVKKEYAEKLKELNAQIKDKLAKENESKKESGENAPKNSGSVKIKNLRDLSEDEKKKLASNPAAIAKLFEALATGELKTATSSRPLKEDERFHLNQILEDVYMYRLQEQGLVDIKVEEKEGGKKVTIEGKNNDPLKRVSTMRLKGTFKSASGLASEQDVGLEL